MEGRHGKRKEKAGSPELLKARQEEETALLRDYSKLKDSLKQITDSKKKDSDALKTTALIIQLNPGYYSVWNLRRTILHEGFLQNTNEETTQGIFNEEIKFVDEILKQNPKSYCAWNHRRWCVEQMGRGSSWEDELAMTDKILKDDPRNYHGWDYRRHIIRQLDLQNQSPTEEALQRLQSELEFTTLKIKEDPSNYSAWHSRSKLINELAENMAEKDKKAMIDSEFDLVKDVVYKNPDNQSAWLYNLGLIGREEPSISIIGASVISFHPLEVVVAFDQNVKLRNPFTVSTMLDHNVVPLEGEWKATGSDSSLGYIWIFQQVSGSVYGPTVEIVIFANDVYGVKAGSKLGSPAVCFEVETGEQDFGVISGRLNQLVVGKNLMIDVTKRLGPVSNPDGTLEAIREPEVKHVVTSLTTSTSLQDRRVVLEREIAVARELMGVEPDCKWPIQVLTTLLLELRKTISLHSAEARIIDDECIGLLEKLITLDPLRQERYEDRRTQLVFDRETLHLLKDAKRSHGMEFADEQPRDLDLSMRGLTHIPISSYLMHLHTLDLDSNAITSTRFLRNLLNVRRVNLANNLIERLEGLQHAPSLEFLSLENNLIATWEDVFSGFVFWHEGKLGRMGAQVKVLLGLNPVIENEGGEYVLEHRWEDVGEVGVDIQWISEEARLAAETHATVVSGTRRVSINVILDGTH